MAQTVQRSSLNMREMPNAHPCPPVITSRRSRGGCCNHYIYHVLYVLTFCSQHVTADLFYSLDTIFQWNEYYRVWFTDNLYMNTTTLHGGSF